MSYSQGDEEAVVLGYFGERVGRLLDVGAYDGRAISNTLALIERGWLAVLVEPSPRPLDALLRLHGANPLVTVIAAVVTERGGWVTLLDTGGDCVSSTVPKVAHRSSNPAYPLIVPSVTPLDLAGRFGGFFDFVSIDTEGTSAALFMAMRSAIHADCWCIEHDNRQREIAAALKPMGYALLLENKENVIFGRKS